MKNPLQIYAGLILPNLSLLSVLSSADASSNIVSRSLLRQQRQLQQLRPEREFDQSYHASGTPEATRHAGEIQPKDLAGVYSDSPTTSKLEDTSSSTRKLISETINNIKSESYELWEPRKIWDALHRWTALYPNLARLTTSQEKYNLPRAGNADDCPYDNDNDSEVGCKNYILTIQDFVIHPEDSESSRLLPEVFWSGALHGNERVGPTAVMEAAKLLLQAASCEAMSRHKSATTTVVTTTVTTMNRQSSNKREDRDFFANIIEGDTGDTNDAYQVCRNQLAMKFGINDVERKWLARLVTTRRIVILPTANAVGYYRNTRGEDGIDPNRDFPYDVLDATSCMRTITGRTLNEVFRDHMFQLCLTFHAGVEVIGYEWGSPSWLSYLSPDHNSQEEISNAFSQFSGNFTTSANYPTGTMNDLVYYIRGGFEDWAYAGSWDPDRVIECRPTTFNGYPSEKTRYDNSTLRAFNMLVETSNQKTPISSTLGSSKDVLKSDTGGNGHVSRNVRLSLLSAELVEPYVSILGANNFVVAEDWIPLTPHRVENDGGLSCKETKKVKIQVTSLDSINIFWTVGGALEIDSTSVWYGKWDDLLSDEVLLDDCRIRSSVNFVDLNFSSALPMNALNGTGYFSNEGPNPHPSSTKNFFDETLGPIFHATIDVLLLAQNNRIGEEIVVIASAMVDQSWANQPEKGDFAPNVPPQSHIVNARTNPSWYHETDSGKLVHGRLQWYSMPLTIVVSDNSDGGAENDAGTVDSYRSDTIAQNEQSSSHNGNAVVEYEINGEDDNKGDDTAASTSPMSSSNASTMTRKEFGVHKIARYVQSSFAFTMLTVALLWT